jgi:hypothetical protein
MTYNFSKGIKTVSISGQDDVVADLTEDTLTFIAGDNITLTTSAAGDSVTIAASGGGGGTSRGTFQARGYFKVASSTQIYGHVWEGYSTPMQWTYGLGSAPSSPADGDTLSFSPAVSAAYGGLWVVPLAGNLTKLVGNWYVPSNTSSDGRWRMRLWKTTPSDGSTSDLTWTAIGTGAVSAGSTNSTIYNVSQDLSSSSNKGISAGDFLMLTFDGRSIGGSNYGSSNSNNRQTFHATLVMEYS